MNPKRMFVIDGAAGAGKSDLLEFVERQIAGHKAAILKKFTTRKLRPEEERIRKALDLKFVKEKEFDALQKVGDFYSYRYPRRGGERYGFYKSDHYCPIISRITAVGSDFPENGTDRQGLETLAK